MLYEGVAVSSFLKVQILAPITLTFISVVFVEEIIKNRGEKRDNTYAEEIELFYSNSNCSQQRYNK